MARYIAGLDPGLTETGLVVLDNGFEISNQTLIRVKPSPAKRLYEIEQAVDNVLSQYTDIYVYIEGYAYGAKYQRESLAELGGVLRRYFYINNLQYYVIPPRILKEYVSGTGRANKNFMKKRTLEKWGLHFDSDDICDAYGLARLGICVDNAYGSNNLQEQKVVDDIRKNVGHYRCANTSKRKKRK